MCETRAPSSVLKLSYGTGRGEIPNASQTPLDPFSPDEQRLCLAFPKQHDEESNRHCEN